ncbi:MAG: hypothetical protein NC938_00485 [Candidatus Omnitrophica bacterium]|nr:hypothetical protein [Candidatus Omnitrophota bacterium]
MPVKNKKKIAKKAARKKVKKTAKPPRRKVAKRSKAKIKISRAVTAKKAMKISQGPEASLEKIGEVTHYFPHVRAAAVMLLKDGLKVGDEIYLKGHTTDFKEKVESMQLDHVPIQEGKKGQEIGLLVKERVRIGDSVYRL